MMVMTERRWGIGDGIYGLKCRIVEERESGETRRGGWALYSRMGIALPRRRYELKKKENINIKRDIPRVNVF